MTPPARRAKDLFLEVVDLGPPEERAAFLGRACAGDAELRRRVEALLEAHERPESLLDRAATAPDSGETLPRAAGGPTGPGAEGIDLVIGPYALRERLGDGGMGVVFRAEQAEPVRREVALKLIRPGMDTEQVLARFEAERQALELMDHPNIARVLDAGATEAGRPYFVMELVRGTPITRYCDERRLTPRQRLELFGAVCAAIQHAHQKGIIHRDIKPSNVLVTEVDGKPVPKVIDFGVAKAIDPGRGGRTLLTQHGAIVGTPEYMSPEQAGSAPDIDTRTDVYSLGVLLYELLTGTTPVDRGTLREAALAEVLRQVREAEPPRPSTRLSDSGDRLPSVAAVRGTEPARLTRLVRGDLDWVVMKTLEKDRARRYETAAALADDIRRHLAGDPVEAGPPSRTYRLCKFARKHRAALATASSFALLLVGATAVSAWEAWRATRAETLAEAHLTDTKKAQAATQEALKQSEQARQQAEAISTFLTETFRSPDPDKDGRQVKVADVLDRAIERLDRDSTESPSTRGSLLVTLGETYYALGLYDRAVATSERARAVLGAALGPDHPDMLRARSNLAAAYVKTGRVDEAIREHEATLKLRESRLGPDHAGTLVSRANLAAAYRMGGRTADAIRMFETMIPLAESRFGPDGLETLVMRSNLAVLYVDAGRVADAIRENQATLRLMESKLGPDDTTTLGTRGNLAEALLTAGRMTEAIRLIEPTLRLMESKLGPDHPSTLTYRNNLASAYLDVGRVAEAIRENQATLRLMESKLGPDHPSTLNTRSNLAFAYRKAGRRAEAVAEWERLMPAARKAFPPGHPSLLRAMFNLADTLETLNRWDDAERLRREILAGSRASEYGLEPALPDNLDALGRVLMKRSGDREAEAILRESLAIREKAHPESWLAFSTRSLLGGSLLGQGRYAEAEPLVVGGYEGMKAREATIGPRNRHLLPEAADRVIALYECWGKADRVRAWKQKLGILDLPADVFARP